MKRVPKLTRKQLAERAAERKAAPSKLTPAQARNQRKNARRRDIVRLVARNRARENA